MATTHTAISEFLTSTRANIALLAALLASVLFAAIGGALDFSNSYRVRNALQEAADAGALAAAFAHVNREDVETRFQIAARRTFQTNYGDGDGVSELSYRLSRPDQSSFTVTASANVQTRFLSAVGRDMIPIAVQATATTPAMTLGAEYAIAIDVSNSIAFGGGWNDAIDTLVAVLNHLSLHADPRHFYVTLVPFTDRVNVGRANWLPGAAPPGWNGCYEPREEPIAGYPWSLNDDRPRTERFDASIPGVTGGLVNFRPDYPKCSPVPITGPTNDVSVI